MKSKVKSFVIGMLCGGFLLGGVGYAADKLQIEVKLPNISYFYDGKELSLGEDAPQTILYKDINYVSVRALAEGLDKEVTWDESEGKVLMHSMDQLKFETVRQEEMTPEIERWVKLSLNKESTLLRTIDGVTYILLALGEKTSGGYEIDVTEIKQYYDGIKVMANIKEPDKTMIVTGAFTYPYQLVKLSGEYKGPVNTIKNQLN